MRKKVGIVKRLFTLLLIFLLSINSFAAIVSDNDGSAFITKAEFDALKSSFQSQIDTYNQSIDSKIDGAIASYLEGISLLTKEEKRIQVASLINAGYVGGKTFTATYSQLGSRNRTIGNVAVIGGNASTGMSISGTSVTIPSALRTDDNFIKYWHAWNHSQAGDPDTTSKRFIIDQDGHIISYNFNDMTVVVDATFQKNYTSAVKWFVQNKLTNPVKIGEIQACTMKFGGIGNKNQPDPRYINAYDTTSRTWLSTNNSAQYWNNSYLQCIRLTVVYLEGTLSNNTTLDFFWDFTNNNINRNTSSFDFVALNDSTKTKNEKYMNYDYYSNNARSDDGWLSNEGYNTGSLIEYFDASINYVDYYCASDNLRQVKNLSYQKIDDLLKENRNYIDEPLIIFENDTHKNAKVEFKIATTFAGANGYIYLFKKNAFGDWNPIAVDGYDVYNNRKMASKDVSTTIKCNIDATDTALGIAATNADGTIDLKFKSIDDVCVITYTD